MLLPQSAAFAALKNRLNSVSAIGYLHIPSSATTRGPGSNPGPNTNNVVPVAFERANRLKPREEGPVKWTELLDKFRTTQDRARRSRPSTNAITNGNGNFGDGIGIDLDAAEAMAGQRKLLPPADLHARQTRSQQAGGAAGLQAGHRSRFSASNIGMGRLTSVVKSKTKK